MRKFHQEMLKNHGFFPIPHTASRRQIDATPCNAMQIVRKRLQDIQFIVKAVTHHRWPIFGLQNFWWKCGNGVPWNRSNPSKSHRSNLSSPPIYPSVCLLASPCVYLICLSFLPHTPYLCRILCAYLCACLSNLSIYLSIYLSISLSIYLPIYLYHPLPTYLPIYLLDMSKHNPLPIPVAGPLQAAEARWWQLWNRQRSWLRLENGDVCPLFGKWYEPKNGDSSPDLHFFCNWWCSIDIPSLSPLLGS